MPAMASERQLAAAAGLPVKEKAAIASAATLPAKPVFRTIFSL
jgi:hypothetical protein